MWDKKCFDIDFYKTYNVDQTIHDIGKTFVAIGVGSVKIIDGVCWHILEKMQTKFGQKLLLIDMK